MVEELLCRHCGESVRAGLVRCWNCGNFMRDDIARTYKEMLASERPVIYSDSAEAEPEIMLAEDHDFTLDGDDDFELSEQTPPEAAPAPTATAPPTTTPDPTAEQAPPAESETIPLASDGDDNTGAASPVAAESGEAGDSPEKSEAESKRPRGDSATAPQVAHSEETGGDVLLQIAMEEQKANKKKRAQTPRSKDGFFINCPSTNCNALIEVRERHRGRIGKCPRCRSPYLVPTKVAPTQEEQQAEAAQAEAQPKRVKGWLKEASLHNVDPAKLKLTPGSLEGSAETRDLIIVPEGLIISVPLKAAGGLFGLGAPKPEKFEQARAEISEFLEGGGPLADTPGESKVVLETEALAAIRVVQPAPADTESLFADIPIFGEHRVALRIPKFEESQNQQPYLSFHLSGFREFAAAAKEAWGIDLADEKLPVPVDDSYTERECHYTDQKLYELDQADWSVADETIETETVGYRCSNCSLTISEDGRKKEKIGGKTPKGLAKAKCPKCEQPFGVNPVVTRPDYPPTDDEEENAEEEG